MKTALRSRLLTAARLLFLLLPMVTVTSQSMMNQATAADWPQFQGLNRDATSPEKGIAREWPAEGPRVVWSVPLGEGFAAPAVYAGEVYVLDRVDEKQDVLRCLDLDTGRELWTFSYDAPGRLSYNGSRQTPTVTKSRVYMSGPFGHFHCLDRETREVVWKANLVADFGRGKEPNWGVTQSPSLYKNLVVVAVQGPDAAVAAFDQETGDVVWKSPAMPGGDSYVSPRVCTLAGVDQAVMVSGGGRGGNGAVTGFSMEDGAQLWTYEGWQCAIPIPYPTPVGEDRLLITGDYGAGTTMIRIVKTDGGFKAEEVFHVGFADGLAHQPILHEGHFYMNGSGKAGGDRNGLVCMTPDGQLKWRTRDLAEDMTHFEYGGLLLADGLLFSIDGTNGDLRLIEANPDEYRELAKATGILGGRVVWGAMALSDGKLLVRDQSKMCCLDVKNP